MKIEIKEQGTGALLLDGNFLYWYRGSHVDVKVIDDMDMSKDITTQTEETKVKFRLEDINELVIKKKADVYEITLFLLDCNQYEKYKDNQLIITTRDAEAKDKVTKINQAINERRNLNE